MQFNSFCDPWELSLGWGLLKPVCAVHISLPQSKPCSTESQNVVQQSSAKLGVMHVALLE